jgi:hypothetical protein
VVIIDQRLQQVGGNLPGISPPLKRSRPLKLGLPGTVKPGLADAILQEYGQAGTCFDLSKEPDTSGLGAEQIGLTPTQRRRRLGNQQWRTASAAQAFSGSR